MTDFRRRLRYRNARWREAHGHPIGTQPIDPRPDDRAPRLVGSRIPLAYARETGATFLTDGALAAAKARSAVVEPNQSLDHQRTWADLLWSPTLAFNLFGDLAGDLERADRAVRALFPDAPGTVREIRFSHSPGWLDPAYLGSLRDFDAAIVLDVGNGKRGIMAVDVKYHERNKAETPKPENMHRYLAVANGSGAFAPGATDALARRSDLAVVWLEHLLLHSMLQHAGGSWTLGPLRRRPPGGQLRRRRRLRTVPAAAQRSVDVRYGNHRGPPWGGRPAEIDRSATPGAVPAGLIARRVASVQRHPPSRCLSADRAAW